MAVINVMLTELFYTYVSKRWVSVNKDQASTVYYRSAVKQWNKHLRALNCLKTEFIPGFVAVTNGEMGQYDYLTAF
jgi:hypothetical protein